MNLPRNTTRQAEGLPYTELARLIHRVTGGVIIVFVLVHVVAQMILHAPLFAGLKAQAPWLPIMQKQHWIHGILYFSIAFHALYGLKLLAAELGLGLDYKKSLLVIVCASALFGLRELVRYAGI